MPAKQSSLDFPIRKTRVSRTKDKIVEETRDVSRGRTGRRQNKKNEDCDSPRLSSRREHSLSKANENIAEEHNLQRTPTKRKIIPEYDQENCCSPPKAIPSRVHLENKENSKNAQSKACLKLSANSKQENIKTGYPVKENPRVVLSHVKFHSPERCENQNEIVLRSHSPFKSPLKSSNINKINSPQRSVNRLSFQSPSKSPLALKRLDLSSPAKSPLALKRLDLSSPAKSPLALKRLDLSSPAKSPLALKRLDLSSPAKSPLALKRLDLSSPAKSPLRFGMCSPVKSASKCLDLNGLTKSPLKRLDFGSPRKSPRKLNIEDGSPRRSPRKLPMSPLKFSSPSSLVSKLSLSSPSSSKKSVSVSLFKPNVTAYRAIRQSLNTGTPTTLVCRDEQISAMEDFLTKHLQKGKPGSLYVSGAPGTGKTACLNTIVDGMKSNHIKKVSLNCMTLKTSASIYGKIVSELGLQLRTTEKENTRLIVKTLTSSKHPILIVLDEIDQLDSKHQEVLYSIFEWPALKDSKLVLVGIANALDLTDRVLPRLQSRPTFKPQLLHFPPYSKVEIVKILNQRIHEAGLDDIQIIRPTAVQFLAGKVASVAGDVRKALDVCRRAVELCEIQARRQTVLKPTICSPRKSPRKSPKKPEMALKMVEIPQVMAIFNEVYGSRVISAVTNAPDSFSLQQKLLICCFLLFLKHARSKDITLGKFHEVYNKVCKKHNIPSMDQSEFLTLCTLLESRGMLQIKRSKEIRSSKVFLRLNPEEAEQALGDRTLLATVLEDKESLGKLCKA